MHRIVVNVQTGEVMQIELTAEEIAAINAEKVPEEVPAEVPVEPEQTTE